MELKLYSYNLISIKNLFFDIRIIHVFTLKLSVILADIVEAGAFTATYLLLTSKRPYCNCLINNKDLNNMSLSNDDVILRTSKIIKEAINTNQAYEFSVHTKFNFF